jgi:segregation and condensation protein B
MTETEISQKQKIQAAVEALLFIYGEPLEINRLAKTLGVQPNEISDAIETLVALYEQENRGLTLVRNEKAVQLVTKPNLSPIVEKFVKEDFSEELTPASLETLAIVLYAGPISRAEIEYIRGVNSSFILRSLLLRGLITRAPDPKRANTYLYEASFDLLRALGIKSSRDLPEAKKYRALLETFRNPQSSENNAPQVQ